MATPGAGAMGITGLAQFLKTRFDEWKAEKENSLVPRFQAALDAMNFKDDARFPSFKSGEGEGWRSNDYLPIIKVKVMTTFATLIDIILQGGEVPFDLKLSRYSRDHALPPDQLEKKIAVMRDRIRQHLRDRKADRQYLRKLFSLVMYGMAFSKYNVQPVTRKGYQQVETLMGVGDFQPYTLTETIPGHDYVSVWNVFWDMEFEDLQDGGGVFERTFMTPYEVRQLLTAPPEYGYVQEHLKRALVASYRQTTQIHDAHTLTPGLREIQKRKRGIPRYEFWGRAPRNLVEEFVKRMEGDFTYHLLPTAWDEDEGDDVEIMAEMIDDEVVRISTDVPEKRPFKKYVWEDELDTGTGCGVPDNLSHIQRAYVGLLRAFIDNKKLSANVILATKRRFLVDPDSVRDLKPGTEIEIADECEDANKAVKQVVIQDVGASLLDGVGLMDRWKDTASMVPEILQGATLPKQQPDTAYELSQLQENAGRYLGMGIKNIDEHLIEDEITDIYAYIMDFDEDPNLKGDYVVHATGFQTFKDRVLRGQRIKELLALVVSAPPLTAEARLRRYLDEIHRTMDVDPDEFLKSDEEKAQDAKAQIEAEKAARAQAIQDAATATQIEQDAKDKAAEDQFQREVLRDATQTAAGREDMAFNAMVNNVTQQSDLSTGGPATNKGRPTAKEKGCKK